MLLAEGARFNEAISRLAPTTFIRKGVYRFSSHEDANRHEQDCLVQGMGLLAARRAKTMRDKDIADRIIIERALEVFRARARRSDDDRKAES